MKKKLFILMLSVLSFSIISCKEEVDFKSGNTKKSNKILINNVGINVISYQDIDGQECEILEFASTIDFDLTLSYLDAKAMEYEDYIDDNYGDLSEEEFDLLIENGIYDDNHPLIDFENEVSFTMSLRKSYDILEREWMSVEDNDELVHPKSLYPFTKYEMTLFNKYGEVKIGESIFIFDTLGLIEITNGDFELLKYVKDHKYEISESEFIKVKRKNNSESEEDCKWWKNKEEYFTWSNRKGLKHVHFHNYSWKVTSNVELTTYKKKYGIWWRHRTALFCRNYTRYYDGFCGQIGTAGGTDRDKKGSNLNCFVTKWDNDPDDVYFYNCNRNNPTYGYFEVESQNVYQNLIW